MRFAPDTEDILEFAVAVANTSPSASRSGDDELGTIDQMSAMLHRYAYTGRVDRDEAELAQLRETRALVRHIWSLEVDDAVPLVNAMFRESESLPYLIRHDHFDWHLHATGLDAPLVDRMRSELAIAFADVIRSREWARLRECEATDCDGVFVDLSRNGSKRFCSVRCGNRMNQLALRERALET